MKIVTWSAVEESKPSSMLEPGGYVVRIVDVEDNPNSEYLRVAFDVAEGPCRGIYAGMSRDENWKRSFIRSYKETAKGMFKAFLRRLEESNNGRFNITAWERTGNENALIGLEIGLIVGKRFYTNDKGEDKETRNFEVCASQDIRNGSFKPLAEKDEREKVPTAAPAPASSGYPNDEDVPF